MLSDNDRQRIEQEAKLYAKNHSAAPDKETPDWIITDFCSGAAYEHNYQLEQQKKIQDENEMLKIMVKDKYKYMTEPLRIEQLEAEREQQAKELPDGIVYVIKGKYYVESSERVHDGDTLHCVVHGQVSASTEQKIGFGDTCTVNLHWDRVNFDNGEEYVYWPDRFKKLKQLEAERSEVRSENEYLKQLLKCAADMLPTYVGPPEKPEINTQSQELFYRIQDAINSLKTK